MKWHSLFLFPHRLRRCLSTLAEGMIEFLCMNSTRRHSDHKGIFDVTLEMALSCCSSRATQERRIMKWSESSMVTVAVIRGSRLVDLYLNTIQWTKCPKRKTPSLRSTSFTLNLDDLLNGRQFFRMSNRLLPPGFAHYYKFISRLTFSVERFEKWNWKVDKL